MTHAVDDPTMDFRDSCEKKKKKKILDIFKSQLEKPPFFNQPAFPGIPERGVLLANWMSSIQPWLVAHSFSSGLSWTVQDPRRIAATRQHRQRRRSHRQSCFWGNNENDELQPHCLTKMPTPLLCTSCTRFYYLSLEAAALLLADSVWVSTALVASSELLRLLLFQSSTCRATKYASSPIWPFKMLSML